MGAKEVLLSTASARVVTSSPFQVEEVGGITALRLAMRMQQDRLGVLSALQPRGDVVVVRAGWKRLVFIFNHKLARGLLGDPQDAQEKGLGLADARLIFGDGLLTATADRWHHQRRRMAKAFNARTLPASLDAMGTMCARQGEACARDGRPVSVRQLATKLALGTVAKAQFDTEFDDDEQAWLTTRLGVVCDLAQRRMTSALNLPLRWPTPRHQRALRAQRELHTWARHQVVSCAANPDRRPANAFLATLQAHGEQDQQQLVDEALTVLMAGHETVAATVSWALLYLATHPHGQQRLYEHLQTLPPSATPTEIVREAAYALAVVEETLRLQPPVWMITRRPTGALTVGSVDVGPGTELLVPVWALHRDPRVWHAAERFDPDRFFDPMRRSATASAYLPFGAGPRLCIGRRQGLGESVLAISELVRRFHISPIGASREMASWVSEQGLTLLPSHDLRIQLRPR